MNNQQDDVIQVASNLARRPASLRKDLCDINIPMRDIIPNLSELLERCHD